MNKQQFHIPMPDEKTIDEQIQQIVNTGLQQRKRSFYNYLKQMYQQIGFKHLFSDRSELIFALLTAITFLMIHFFISQHSQVQEEDLYGVIFMSSPVLFLILTAYTYINKTLNNTIEVEMTYKYNMFQMIGFRMFMYSIIAILFNSLLILSLSFIYTEVQFFRAFMISNTGLFTFSVLLLYAMKKYRSAIFAALITVGWVLGNLMFRVASRELYHDVLIEMPLFVYAIVLAVVFYFNFKFLKKLFNFQYTKGAS